MHASIDSLSQSLTINDFNRMENCLELAEKSLKSGEFPAACIIFKDSKIISSAHNSRNILQSKLAHAEVLAIHAAEEILGEYLRGCTAYINIEPCLMCFAAFCACRVSRVVFGAFDFGAGTGNISNLPPHYREFSPTVVGGCLEQRSYELIKCFAATTGATWPLQYYHPPAVA